MTSRPSARRGVKHRAGRFDDSAQQADIIAEGGAKATRLQKVALHIDDEQCGPSGREIEWIGSCIYRHVLPRSLKPVQASGQYDANAARTSYTQNDLGGLGAAMRQPIP